ncbi:hypothetical protein [Mycobacterium leprae]|nr:hypothetical protein [Mycobacterium leprae]
MAIPRDDDADAGLLEEELGNEGPILWWLAHCRPPRGTVDT